MPPSRPPRSRCRPRPWAFAPSSTDPAPCLDRPTCTKRSSNRQAPGDAADAPSAPYRPPLRDPRSSCSATLPLFRGAAQTQIGSRGGLTAKTAPASYNEPSSQTVEVLAVETFLLIAAAIGMISGSLAIVTAIYAGAKRLVARFRKDDGSLSPPMTMVNWIAIGLETTIIVPVVIETVIEKVVPVFVPPQSPRPTIPEWLTRPKQPPEVRPDPRPDKSRPSFTRPGSRPSAPEYTHRRPEITTRRAEADVDYATRLGGRGGVGSPPRSGSPPDGSGPGSVDRGFQGGTNRGGSPGDHRR